MVHRQPELDPETNTSQRPRVFLLPEEPPGSLDQPSRLAQWLGLLKYKNSLLTVAAHHELRAMAWVLLVVCIFEVVVWTFFFNAVFNRDVTYIGRATIGAVVTAGIFGLVVFFFERQMLTFDVGGARAGWRRWVRILTAGAFRLAYIGITAWITSIAFELRFFRPAILDRAHEEAVRESVVRYWLETNEAKKKADDIAKGRATGTVSQAERATLEELTLSLTDAERALNDAESARDRFSADISAAEAERAALERDQRTGADPDATRRIIRALEVRAARLRVNERTANERVSARQLEVSRVRKQMSDVGVNIDEARRLAAVRAEELRARLDTWVSDLGKLKPGAGHALKEWHFAPAPPDFLEQLRILDDLRLGHPPLWPGAPDDAKRRVHGEYGFQDVHCDVDAPDSSACREVEANQEAFLKGHRISWLLALLIPSLMVVVKLFMMPDELRIYYSRLHQARAGEPEARRLTHIDEQLRAEAQARRGDA